MRFSYPEMDRVFDLSDGTLNTVVIENPVFLYRLLTDVNQQIEGCKGKAVVSQDDCPMDLSKTVEILNTFVPFDLSRKGLLTKITTALEKQALSPEHYSTTMQMLGELEQYLNSLAFAFPCDIDFPKLSAGMLIKSASPEVRDDSTCLAEKVINYMELVREFERDKLFITVNLRNYISDEEAELFAGTVIPHGYQILMLECVEKKKLALENRLIIDSDLCEIG